MQKLNLIQHQNPVILLFFLTFSYLAKKGCCVLWKFHAKKRNEQIKSFKNLFNKILRIICGIIEFVYSAEQYGCINTTRLPELAQKHSMQQPTESNFRCQPLIHIRRILGSGKIKVESGKEGGRNRIFTATDQNGLFPFS